ncbi:MAG TPA: carboxypeptidase-like regulatory domain-containing protein [Luteibaculaceae bacterium]|nr:carboxypeptidase-like regulatory domain-containing protein [Luteibaculaceae bacterium]
MKFLSTISLLTLLIGACLGPHQRLLGQARVIQLSGVVVTGDSLKPVPYVNVLIKSKYYGATTDYFGYFSLPVLAGDTLIFSSLGYKKSVYVLDSDLKEERYSVVHVVQPDTIMLSETVIYPWPSKEQFKEAFMNLDIPDDEIARAEKNLNPELIYQKALEMPSTGSMNFKNQMALKQAQLYYNGQAPPITVLNPFAWAQFIKAWREGKFKRKTTEP